MARADVQGYSDKLERELSRIRASPEINCTDKLKEFARKRTQNASDGRIQSELAKIRYIAENNDFSIDNLDEEKIEEICIQIANSEYKSSGDYADSYKDEFRKSLKRWLEYLEVQELEDKLPDSFSQNTHKPGSTTDPRELTTPSAVRDICRELEARRQPRYARRDVAACLLMWDAGCRVSAVLRMDVGDIRIEGKDVWARIAATKDSPSREIRLIVAAPMLKHYLENVHPEPDNPQMPLFPTMQNRKYRRQKVKEFRSVLKHSANKAGVSKKMNPHNWRRGRSTFLHKHEIMGIQEIMKRCGWSSMETLNAYLNMTVEDSNWSYAEAYGAETDREQKGADADLTPFECVSCNRLVSGHKFTCPECGAELDKEAFDYEDNLKRDKEESLLDMAYGYKAANPEVEFDEAVKWAMQQKKREESDESDS